MPRDPDPDGSAWRAQADAAWSAAEARAAVEGGSPRDYYEPVPLPDFGRQRTPHVHRQLLGRYLYDRDSGLVHDCQAAAPECALDDISAATFIHFHHELAAALPEGAARHSCMPEETLP